MGYKGLQVVTSGYRGLQGVTRTNEGLQGKGLQGVTGAYNSYKRLQEITRGYSWLLKVYMG